MSDLEALLAIRERARALGFGELMHLRVGAAGPRVWVAFTRANPSYGSTLVEACMAWIAAHPAPEEGA